MRFIILALLILSIAHAVPVTLIDAGSGAPISDSYVLIKTKVDGNAMDISGTTRNGRFELSLPSGTYDSALFVDTISTPGKDYYLKQIIRSEETPFDLIVYPVGSINGRVIYDQNIVAPNADLMFDCDKDFGIEYPLRTDSTGYFSIAYFPSGTCRIRAQYNNLYGSTNVNVEAGTAHELILELTERVPTHTYWLYGIGALVIVSLAYFLLPRKKNTTRVEIKETVDLRKETAPSEIETIMKDARIKGMLATLSKDERAIVEHVIAHRFKASQPAIYKATLIPKTSLARQIIQLEHKNILVSRKNRKIKEVELSETFLGEHKKQ